MCENLHGFNLSAVEFTCLAVLSIIIGTLIYHFEKNIWSYGLQILFTSNKLSVWCCIWIIGAVLFGVIAIVSIFISPRVLFLILCISLVVAFSACLLSVFCVEGACVEITEQMWLAEAGKKIPDKGGALDGESAKIIMAKVSTWSDFIHCGQSCAWAWILGSSFAYQLIEKPILQVGFWIGLFSAVLLLVAEAFIDWHRWQHIVKVADVIPCAKGCFYSRVRKICRNCRRRSSKSCTVWRFFRLNCLNNKTCSDHLNDK